VSDNASLDDTQEKVLAIKDTRLQYVNTGTRVSMSENWEFALSQVKEGWVTILGDDDAILPGSLARVDEIIHQTRTEAIRSNGCYFAWPDLCGSNYGALSVSLSKGYELRDSRRALQHVLNGFLPYNELPMLYNGGFISMRLVESARKHSNSFFNSMTPDVYSAIVFSMLTSNYIYCNEPLAVNGASLHSGGTAAFEKSKRIRQYNPAEKFWKEKNIPFHKDLPLLANGRPVSSIPVLVYECYLQALQCLRRNDTMISRRRLIMLALAQGGPSKSEINEWIISFCEMHSMLIPNRLSCVCLSALYSLHKLFCRVLAFLLTFRLKGNRWLPLKDVHQASIAAGVIKGLRLSPVIAVERRLFS
jgi:hypothetical protein